MKFLLDFLERHDRKRVIMDRESSEPYLNRYYILLKERKKSPFNIFLHQFLKSDPDDLHDHPWPYATFIIKGGYWEWTPIIIDGIITGEKKLWRGAGHFRICKADTYHRIELQPDVDCWTIFMPGIRKREWGFLTHVHWKYDTQQWIKYNEYINNRKQVSK